MSPITVSYIESIVSDIVQHKFTDHLADSATWTLANDSPCTNPLFGTRSKADFVAFIGKKYIPIFAGPPAVEVTSVTVTDNRAVLEVHLAAPLKTGKQYDQRSCWVLEFDENTMKVVKLREYFDTLLGYESIMEYEKLGNKE